MTRTIESPLHREGKVLARECSVRVANVGPVNGVGSPTDIGSWEIGIVVGENEKLMAANLVNQGEDFEHHPGADLCCADDVNVILMSIETASARTSTKRMRRYSRICRN